MTPFPSFEQFFTAIWNRAPYPWQVRLADAAATGAWPAWITLPTGAGKTACLDIAVYCLARQAALPPAERSAPVRIVFAVNRRIVVDEAFSRARHLCSCLGSALLTPDSVLHPVAAALLQLAGPGAKHPLEAYPLRGGTFTDNSWARSPFQPLIISTTLDQLGSRLLFRGFGVTPNAQPIHAALLGNDALLILDEAHTSAAFSQTLHSIADLRLRCLENIPLPFHAVQLTATPPPDAASPFTLNPEDRDPQACPALSRRLSSSKPSTYAQVAGAKGSKRHEKLAQEMATHATAFLEAGHRRVLVIVNRVATAESTAAAVTKALSRRSSSSHQSVGSPPTPKVAILTGRMRPLDRDAAVHDLTSTHQIGRSDPDPDVPPLVLVATQCIEVGADFDFDALITEIAPLDALRQRFGRLNRSGRLASSPAIILAPEDALDESKPDRLYGTTLPHVWNWLSASGPTIDFGPDAFDRVAPTGPTLASCLAPVCDSPILLPPHLDMLCQTSPRPHVEPDVTCFIHGIQKPNASVSVMVRRGLDHSADEIRDMLNAAPPLGTEIAEVPLYVAQEWLRTTGHTAPIKADDSGDGIEPESTRRDRHSPSAINISPSPWRFSRDSLHPLSSAEELAPGDTIILPEGLDLTGLLAIPTAHGTTQNTADDQFESAHLLARDKVCLRISLRDLTALPSLAAKADRPAMEALIATTVVTDANDDEPPTLDLDALAAAMPRIAQLIPPSSSNSLWNHAAKVSGRKGNWIATSYGSNAALLRHSARAGVTAWPLEPDDLGFQGDSGTGETLLADHQSAVAQRAASYAACLPTSLRNAVTDAALWHDLGKSDPRFQSLLRCQPLYSVLGKPLLAKSIRSLPLSERNSLAADASLPHGFRHELLSVAVLLSHDPLLSHAERDLVLHLIASHHGRCRAFAPAIEDPDPEPFTANIGTHTSSFDGLNTPCAPLHQGVTERFWQLTRRFGWWGLAYLELLLRLADQVESANSQQRAS
jgi:CRISPR-associated endonuclease/helicase Cas3